MTDAAVFEPVPRSQRLSGAVADQLLEAIFTGRFSVGDLLPSERELAAQFHVSRTVIREAMIALATKGVAEIQSGRGVMVVRIDTAPVSEAMAILLRSMSDMDFFKVHEVRAALELHIVGLASERATENQIEEIEEISRTLEDATDDPEKTSELDVAFHRAIARSTGNELYAVMLDSIAPALLQTRRATLAIPHHPAIVIDQHRQIVEAIKERDATLARDRMAAHLASVERAWRLSREGARDE